jgi:hypothetical protein
MSTNPEKKQDRKEKRKKIKDKVFTFFKEKAPHLLDTIADFLPDNGALGIVKNIIDKDPKIPDSYKADFKEIYELSLRELELINEDVDSARQREVNISNSKGSSWLSKNIVPILAINWTLFAMTIFILVLVGELNLDKGIIMLVINSVSNIIFMIIGYYFGSSKGSKDKQQQLNKL